MLDEADRMLDMGFVHDVKKVIAKLPAKRQNLMFSATMPKEIEHRTCLWCIGVTAHNHERNPASI